MKAKFWAQIFLGAILWGCIQCSQLEDPFLMPFGPDHGDSFATREQCSLGMDLEHAFKIGNEVLNKVYVCLDGVVKFNASEALFSNYWTFDDFDSIDYPIVAPFLTQHRIERYFIDDRCAYSDEENSFYGLSIPWCFETYPELSTEYGSYSYLGNLDPVAGEEHLKRLRKLNDRQLTKEQLESLVLEDDEAARQHYGKNTTKYVNLASHVLRRQVTEGDDLEILKKVIQRKDNTNDVMLEWALVVTWYKIKFRCERDIELHNCFASFQLVVTCSSNRCFTVFNYFEVNGKRRENFNFFCGLFSYQSEVGQPIQCQSDSFSHEQLVQGSNIGVRGLWLYELDQSGQGNVTFLEDLSQVTAQPALTIHDLNSFEADEPYLLKFGSMVEDKFLPWCEYNAYCSYAESFQKQFKFGKFNAEVAFICRDGMISFTSSNDDFFYSLQYDNYNQYTTVIAPLMMRHTYEFDNFFFDYTCLLAEDSVYQTETFFDDMCFRIATKNFYINSNDRGITFDDDKAKALFGSETTKYVNLAGNMFKREINESEDFDKINQLITSKIPSFQATVGYVVTWYKIGARGKPATSFNSFQSIMACADNKDCVVIHDYYEMEWGSAVPEIGADQVWLQIKADDQTGFNLDDPSSLTVNSNFGVPGIWVFFFPGNGNEPSNIFDSSQENNEQSGSTDSEEPFLLPFGPKHHDSLSFQFPLHDPYLLDGCSLPQVLEIPLTIANIQFDWLFVCLKGVIELRSVNFEGTWGELWNTESGIFQQWTANNYYYHRGNEQYNGLNVFGLTMNVFAVDPYEATVDDGFVDYLCLFAQDASDYLDLNLQYLADPSECPDTPPNWRKINWHQSVTMRGWTDKETLEAVINWNLKDRHKDDVDFTSDDSLAEKIFGKNTTKFINLANNIFMRESTNESDLAIVTNFIRTNAANSDFEATWVSVFTWYKVASRSSDNYWVQDDFLQWFNSFQLVLACDDTKETENGIRCLAIYDYFELESVPSSDNIGVFLGGLPGHAIPVGYNNLSRGSNYGFPGRWVLDLFSLADVPNMNDSISLVQERIINADEEPFLLPFGPKYGDGFWEKTSYDYCAPIMFHNPKLTVNGQLFPISELCHGVLFSWFASCSLYDDLQHCPDPVFAIYPLGSIRTQDNLIDYMCTESYMEKENKPEWSYWWGINEFCPLIDSNEESRHPLWFHVEYGSMSGVGGSDEQIAAVHEWNGFITQHTGNVDISTDDDLAKAIFGSDTTKYVNLANNVFKRVTKKESDLYIVNSIVRELYPGFSAAWAVVATWYKLPGSMSGSFAYNSYQAVITCDFKIESTNEDDICVVLFDYFEMQWTGAESAWQRVIAQCGVKENKENFVELPNSGTDKVRNLWAESNVNVPGIWMIDLSQKQNDASIGLPVFQQQCDVKISPRKAVMQAIYTVFTLSGFLCSSEDAPVIAIKFEGAKKSMIAEGALDKETGDISCTLEYWGKSEEVEVTVILDGRDHPSSLKVLFYNPHKLIDPPKMIKLNFAVASDTTINDLELHLDTLESILGDANSEMTVTCIFITRTGSEVVMNKITPSGNTLTFSHSTPRTIILYVICMLETVSNEVVYSDPIKGGSMDSCESWENKEKSRDLSRCLKSLSRWYGCPRETGSRWWWGQREDSFYARAEADQGIMGWEYDVCCNDQNENASSTVSQNGYCDNCQHNPGAEFCIKSVPLACLDSNTGELHYISNQCCYNQDGKLIEQSEPGVGTLHLEESYLGNIMDHSEADLDPFKSCCLEDEGTQGCDIFYKYRPVVEGPYWSRVVRVAMGDPHITTVDNTTYTFNGLNVYWLLISDLQDQTLIQASTRAQGKGTLFSGLAVKYADTVFESFISKDGEFKVFINDEEVELHVMKSFTTNKISITEDTTENSYTFFFTENDVIIKVLVTGTFLNFFTSVPPTFHGKTKGLLGFYDGDPENDLLAADGTTVDVESDLSAIHSQFGETWAVENSDWIFKNDQFVQGIEQDIQDGASYEASYEITFESNELKLQAEEKCGADQQCLLDVALVGDISIADAFVNTKFKMEVFEVFNDVFQNNVPNASVFQESVPAPSVNKPTTKSSGSSPTLTVIMPTVTSMLRLLMSTIEIGWFEKFP